MCNASLRVISVGFGRGGSRVFLRSSAGEGCASPRALTRFGPALGTPVGPLLHQAGSVEAILADFKDRMEG